MHRPSLYILSQIMVNMGWEKPYAGTVKEVRKQFDNTKVALIQFDDGEESFANETHTVTLVSGFPTRECNTHLSP